MWRAASLFIIELIHSEVRTYCNEAFDKFNGDIQSRLDFVDFLLFPFTDDEVDLFPFCEIVAYAEAQAAEVAAAKRLDDVF